MAEIEQLKVTIVELKEKIVRITEEWEAEKKKLLQQLQDLQDAKRQMKEDYEERIRNLQESGAGEMAERLRKMKEDYENKLDTMRDNYEAQIE